MINRSLGNFSEYRFKEKNNSFCFSPNSASPNFFKSLIHQNFPFALQSYRNRYNHGSITIRVNPRFHSQQKPKLSSYHEGIPEIIDEIFHSPEVTKITHIPQDTPAILI